MQNQLTLFDRILKGDLCPWLNENKPDEKFASKLSEIQTFDPEFPLAYSIEFYRPFNHKTKYYNKQLLNETVRYTNTVISAIQQNTDNRIIKFALNDTLNKKLKTKLKFIGDLIKDKNLDIKYINPAHTAFDVDADHKTETYIIHLLKTCFMAIYLEIQDKFKVHIEDVLVKEDFFAQLLFEPVPVHSFIKEVAPIINVENEAKTVETVSIAPKNSILSFTYLKLKHESENLTNLFDSLKLYNLIDQGTSLPNFKKVFSGKVVTTPIKWTGNQSEFYYFIQLLYTKWELMEDVKQRQWEIAVHCFVNKNNTSFDRTKLKNSKTPKTTQALLEKVVSNLK